MCDVSVESPAADNVVQQGMGKYLSLIRMSTFVYYIRIYVHLPSMFVVK